MNQLRFSIPSSSRDAANFIALPAFSTVGKREFDKLYELMIIYFYVTQGIIIMGWGKKILLFPLVCIVENELI